VKPVGRRCEAALFGNREECLQMANVHVTAPFGNPASGGSSLREIDPISFTSLTDTLVISFT
jgi:hypothetical protein